MERERLKKIDRKKKKVLAKQISSRMSLNCGTENPGSLKCTFYVLEGNEIGTVIHPKELHQGHMGIMHGGYVASVLDEAMGRSNCQRDENGYAVYPFVTASMEVVFIRPLLIGETYYVYGRVDREEGRKNFDSAEIIDDEGNVYAMAEALFINTTVNDVDIVDKTTAKEGFAPLSDDDPKEL